ncbi:MAG: S-methyl-5'-thioadenosine phosphorylase [Alphaproteobacteria bacterium]|nr:S-methyl-5'-thioadenosine phosphorylase [Alphaproteobacteria bacterium]
MDSKVTDQKRILGVIGGSGVYAMDALEDVERFTVITPWGAPSDRLVRGRLCGLEVVFLARHGEGHVIAPSDVNYRANIDAMKRAGVTDLISLSACGSFRERLAPGTFVIVDQYIDRTTKRVSSFFGPGFVAHVSMAHPVCPALGAAAEEACKALDIPHASGGTYLAIDGPQFSSLAESNLYRSWGCDVIGMTNMPEAKLAREAELPYATVAMVTDYDCWHEKDGPVEVSHILEIMKQNTANGARLVEKLAALLGPTRTPSPLGIETCLDYAVITSPERRDPAMCEKLSVVAGRFLKG